MLLKFWDTLRKMALVTRLRFTCFISNQKDMLKALIQGWRDLIPVGHMWWLVSLLAWHCGNKSAKLIRCDSRVSFVLKKFGPKIFWLIFLLNWQDKIIVAPSPKEVCNKQKRLQIELALARHIFSEPPGRALWGELGCFGFSGRSARDDWWAHQDYCSDFAEGWHWQSTCQ